MSLLAIQAIKILKGVHKRFIIHRDLKPENLLVSEKSKNLFLVDFGMARRFVDNSGDHLLMRKRRPFRGTYNFCSKNMIRGFDSSRRDDLESLAYVLVYLHKGNYYFSAWFLIRNFSIFFENFVNFF